MILTLEVQEVSFSSTDSLLLTDDDSRHDLLPELGLTLLDRGKEHVTDRAGRETIELGSSHAVGNHEQVLCAGVVTAVHDRSHWETV